MSKLTLQIGFWTSGFLAILGTAYLVILAGITSMDALITMEPTGPGALWAGIDTLLTAFGLVILMACIAQAAPAEKKVLGVIGLAFTILFAAVVCMNRFAQLTIIRQSFLLADTVGLDRFLPYGSRSVFFALEMLGWGGFLSLAAFSVAPLFTTGRLERWIAGMFLTYGILGITSVLGYALDSPIVMVGFIAWGPVLGVAVVLLGILFWRDSRSEQKKRTFHTAKVIMNTHKIHIILSILILIICAPSSSSPAVISPAAQTPIASASIADIITKYRQEIQHRMPKEKVPGLAIAVVDDQDILWTEGFGFTDWDRQTPVTRSTLFSIQSMSKSFTATAAMFAAQDGLVDLDAPITTYLPNFQVNSIFEEHPEQKITLSSMATLYCIPNEPKMKPELSQPIPLPKKSVSLRTTI